MLHLLLLNIGNSISAILYIIDRTFKALALDTGLNFVCYPFLKGFVQFIYDFEAFYVKSLRKLSAFFSPFCKLHFNFYIPVTDQLRMEKSELFFFFAHPPPRAVSSVCVRRAFNH